MDDSIVRERIVKLLELKDVSIRQLSDGDETCRVRLTRQIGGDNAISCGTIMHILGYFPMLSAEWLLRGVFPVFKEENATEKDKSLNEQQFVQSLNNQIRHLEGEVEYLRSLNMALLGMDYDKKKDAV